MVLVLLVLSCTHRAGGLQGRNQGGAGVPFTPPSPFVTLNNIIQTISVRLEQSNLCHLQLRGYLHETGKNSGRYELVPV